MSKPEFTPGEWTMSPPIEHERVGVLSSNGIWVAEAIGCQPGGREQEIANARLLAASKELYEALKGMIECAGEEYSGSRYVEAARAALAKVTGE